MPLLQTLWTEAVLQNVTVPIIPFLGGGCGSASDTAEGSVEEAVPMYIVEEWNRAPET